MMAPTRVAMLQVDGKWPNLALMKLTAWHLSQGDQVVLGHDREADLVYASAAFRTPESQERLRFARELYGDRLRVGGWGADRGTLPLQVEHTRPAYAAWNCVVLGEPASMGFLTRGCSRSCPWCCVPEKEGGIRLASPLGEFAEHDRVTLLDNNLLAHPAHLLILAELAGRGLRYSLSQGVDLRLVRPESAKALAQVKWCDSHFTRQRLYAAWDRPADEEEVLRGLTFLWNAGWQARSVMVYILTNFSTIFKQDFERFTKLVEWGCDPFVMVYRDDGRRVPSWLPHFQRFVNGRIYKACTWEDYTRRKRQGPSDELFAGLDPAVGRAPGTCTDQ